MQNRTAFENDWNQDGRQMISKDNGRAELDESAWRAWIEKNEKRDKVKLARRVKVIAVLIALFALAVLGQKVAG